MVIQLVIFDYGDCLVQYPRALLRAFDRREGIDPARRAREWKNVEPLANTGKLSWREAQARVFGRLGKGPRTIAAWQATYESVFQNRARPVPGVRRALGGLKKQGLKLVILSDSARSSAKKRQVLARFGLAKYFSTIFSSCEIRAAKPSPAAYRYVLRHFRVRPNETVFVGHSQDELDGARKLGMKTIAVVPDADVRGHSRSRWADLPKRVAALNSK